MKGLKLTPLVLCGAIAPMPVLADIQALNDTEMGQVTGQAGVTIELETRVDIGEFRYYDEGALSVSNVEIGGTNRDDLFPELGSLPSPSTLLDDIRMDIDVLSDGDALINIRPLAGAPIDLGVRTGAWMLLGETDSTVILDFFYMDSLVKNAAIVVDTESDVLFFGTNFAIADLAFDSDFIAFGVRDFRLTGANYDPDAPVADDLYADLQLFLYHGSRANGQSALAIEIPQFVADVSMGNVLVGGTSIGSIALDDLAITQTSMRIYGH